MLIKIQTFDELYIRPVVRVDISWQNFKCKSGPNRLSTPWRTDWPAVSGKVTWTLAVLRTFQKRKGTTVVVSRLSFFFFLPNHGRCRGWLHLITHKDTPQSVGLLWTRDRRVAETSTWQHTTLATEKLPCPRRNSNPQSQQAIGRRPSP